MTEQEGMKLASAEQVIIDEFIKDLEATANQVQQLLTEIRDSKIDLATIKAEFKFVVDNVKQLSSLIKDGENGSIMTRLAVVEAGLADIKEELREYISKDTEGGTSLSTKVALLEQKILDVAACLEEIKKDKDEAKSPKTELANTTGKWQLYVAIAGGVFTLLGSIAALLMSLLGK
ncbi:MAG: hypothetical protein ACXADB_00085 [Candidatus Hermodarchaeia archaeon]|jgi:DNA repair exonuclease SbcCD ATPase subunit